jgi:hypothetical protein
MTIFEKIAHLEEICNALNSERTESIARRYEKACKQGDTATAARMARKLRNGLLADSDKEMTLDRIADGNVLEAIEKAINGDWAKYRQALRDLPEQKGFPYTIEFPEIPEKGAN